MRAEYQKELDDLKLQMEKAEKFALKLPIFAEHILECKITGEESHRKFGEKYKKIWLRWGLYRSLYNVDKKPTNFKGDLGAGIYLFQIYVNCYSLFDVHNNFELYESLKSVSIFFSDPINSTFYVTDENIESFLEALNAWYVKAYAELEIYNLNQQEIKLQEQLKKVQEKQLAGF